MGAFLTAGVRMAGYRVDNIMHVIVSQHLFKEGTIIYQQKQSRGIWFNLLSLNEIF